MLGGYLEFFMKPDLASTYLGLKRELDELIHNKVSGCVNSITIQNLPCQTFNCWYLLALLGLLSGWVWVPPDLKPD